jgi:hypothetical protein
MSHDFRPEIEVMLRFKKEIEILRSTFDSPLSKEGAPDSDLLHPKKSACRSRNPGRDENRQVLPARIFRSIPPPSRPGNTSTSTWISGESGPAGPTASPLQPRQLLRNLCRRIEDGFVSNYLLDAVKVGDRLDPPARWETLLSARFPQE